MLRGLSVGVIGLDDGRASRLAREVEALPDAELRWLCVPGADPSTHALCTTDRPDDLFADPELDVVVLSTPLDTQAGLVREALERRKHVVVELPLARDEREVASLLAYAAYRDLQLVIAHPLVFDPAIVKLRELIETQRLGGTRYLHGGRRALDEPAADALWRLGPRDVSVLVYLLGETPVEVVAQAVAPSAGAPEVVFCLLRFEGGITAHLHLSMLDPRPLYRLAVVGSAATAVVEETAPDRQLSLKITHPGRAESRVRLRQDAAPLRRQLQHALDVVRGVAPPLEPSSSIGVVRVLAALNVSLERRGAPVSVRSFRAPRAHVVPLRR